MRTLLKFLLAILFLTVASVGWAACPEGTTQTYKGCEPEEGVVSSSSPTGYCYRTDNQYFYKPVSGNCSSSDRNITKQEYNNRRLSSSTTASSSSPTGYCYRTDNQYFYKPVSGNCSSSDRNITKQEYNNRRLSSSTTASSSSSTTSSTQVTLRVTASHSGAEIRVDGRYSGTTPTTIKVDKGSHTVKISKAGYTDYVTTITVVANRSISAILKRKTTSTTASSGSGSGKVWCLTKSRRSGKFVNYVSKIQCTRWIGAAFSSQSLAEARHQRQKSATTASTSSLTTASKTTAPNEFTGYCYRSSTWLPTFYVYNPTLGRCKDGDRNITREEWEKKELSSAAIASSDSSASITAASAEKVIPEPTQTTKPTQTADTSLELEFWKTIKDSDDPDMYKEYLRQFPEGTYAGLAKLTIKKLSGTTDAVASGIPDLDYGRYHALVIGNNDYDYLSDLRTAINDAQGIASLLREDYGFEVSLLENATRGNIVKALAGLRKTVGSEDNLLVYYAGHGYLDEAVNEGYWLPVDAEREDPSNWLQTDTIVAQIRGMQAKHVMVVADSCFSGTIIRAIKIEQRTPDYLQRIVKKKSRTALTSGGLEPVMDSGGGGKYSVFARSLISLLEENTGVLDASQLFSQLRPKVMVNSTQTPEYGDIHQAGHDGGDFLFVRQ